MLFGKRIIVLLPAYNAEPTLRQTCAVIPGADRRGAVGRERDDGYTPKLLLAMAAPIAANGARRER